MHHSSVSWHIIPLKFFSWNMLYALHKESPSKYTFSDFRVVKWKFTISSCPFSNVKFRVYSNFEIHQRQIISIFFSSNLIYFGQKDPIEKNFRLWNNWVKIHQIPQVIFETTSHFFFKLCTTLQCVREAPFVESI